MANPTKTPGASRRELLRHSGGMLAASATLAVGSCSPTLAPAGTPNPDAELLRRCNAYLREHCRLMSSDDCGGDHAAMLAQYRRDIAAGISNDETLLQVAALPAHTADDMKAKAKIVRLYFGQAYPRDGATLPWPASPQDQVTWSLVNDLLRRT